jgi:hypothetical protein
MYSVGDRVMVDGGGPNLRYEGVIEMVAQNEKDQVMYLVKGEGGSFLVWQNQDAVYAIIRTK